MRKRALNFWRLVEPFDMTYGLVTTKIRERAATLAPGSREWLETLVERFHDERLKWPYQASCKAYLRRGSRFRRRVSHLAVCAYLHISYDLPRVLADEQPGSGRWAALTRDDGANTYFGLDAVFPAVFQEVARKRKIVGPVALFGCLTPHDAMDAASTWVLHLRAVAWEHGGRLASMGNGRELIERAMLESMLLALEDVSDWRPWSAGILRPPHDAFLICGFPLAALLIAQSAPVQSALSNTAIVLAILLVVAIGAMIFVLRRLAALDREEARLVVELGETIKRYLAEAFEDPERVIMMRRFRERSSGPPDRE